MQAEFVRRTLLHIVSRNRPYLVHLCLTHRCNLRCHFCQTPNTRIEELEVSGFERIIDKLDAMGVVVLGLMGGEPLLYRQFARVIEYAAGKGLYVKLTSNGTLAEGAYAELLSTPVAEIAISLDGLSEADSLTSHVGPRILRTLRFLNDHLPPGKRLTITVTVTTANVGTLQDLIDHCSREYPRCRILVNSVVVGNGRQMVTTEARVDPGYLDRVRSPLLLVPRFYRKVCEEYAASDPYNWGCLAGQAFFDVKPNGDLWLCQDQPTRPMLNLLDPDFDEKYRHADFSSRRECTGCTHLCYLLAQRGFEPGYWPDIARLWWLTATSPGDPWRQTAEAHGWFAGLVHLGCARVADARRRSNPPASSTTV